MNGSPVAEIARYGNQIVLPLVFGAAGSQLVLPKSNNQRIFLHLQNTLVAGTILYSFDQPASATFGIQLPVGQSLFCDSFVPQNDLYVFCPFAGQLMLSYSINNSFEGNR